MVEILIAAIVMMILGFAAATLGADSRDGNDWVSHEPTCC